MSEENKTTQESLNTEKNIDSFNEQFLSLMDEKLEKYLSKKDVSNSNSLESISKKYEEDQNKIKLEKIESQQKLEFEDKYLKLKEFMCSKKDGNFFFGDEKVESWKKTAEDITDPHDRYKFLNEQILKEVVFYSKQANLPFVIDHVDKIKDMNDSERDLAMKNAMKIVEHIKSSNSLPKVNLEASSQSIIHKYYQYKDSGNNMVDYVLSSFKNVPNNPKDAVYLSMQNNNGGFSDRTIRV